MKKLVSISAILCLVVSFFSACSMMDTRSDLSQAEASEVIVLGEKKENPFSIARAKSLDSAVTANRFYIRVRSNDSAQLEWLCGAFENTQTTPIDREMLMGGTYYDDPTIQEGSECTWVYLIVTADERSGLTERGFQVETLDEMFVDDALLAEGDTGSLEGSIYESVAPASRIVVNPSGYVKVWDGIVNAYVPLVNAKVVASQWLVFSTCYTDANGYFRISKSFNSFWGKVRIKVVFENDKAMVNRNITEHFFQYFAPAEYSPGEFSVSALSGLRINLGCGTLQAKLGTVLKAVGDYHEFASANGITRPFPLKVVTYKGQGGMTVMGRYTGGVLFASGGTAIGAAGGGPLGAVIGMMAGALITSQLPDLVIGIDFEDTEYTMYISEVVYHECGHASHMRAVGSTYWWSEYFSMLGGWMDQIGEPEFDAYNGGESELVCLVESWGYFTGYYAMHWMYGGYLTPKGRYLDVLENGSGYAYFYYDGLYDLIDSGYEGGDSASGYSVSQIFNALKSARVESAQDYLESFVSLYGNSEAVRMTLVNNGARIQ